MQLKKTYNILQDAAKEIGINFEVVGSKIFVQWLSLIRVNKECLAT